MNVLFASPVVPWPLNSGGKIRSFHLIRALSSEVRIHLRAVLEPGQGPEHARALEPLCASIQLFARESAGLPRRLARAKIERWFHSEGLRAALRRDCASGDFDLLHVDELSLARVPPLRAEIPSVQHHHKLEIELFESVTGGRGPHRHFDLWKLGRLEAESVRRTRSHVFCSEEDRALFEARRGPLEASVVPSGFDPLHFKPRDPPAPRERERLLFLGSMSYAPNVNGICRFVDDVLPRLCARRPRLALDIVGRDPAPEVRRLASAVVDVVGEVPDVRPYLERAALLIVPLRIGGGTRLKIVEALAMGTPVVSTSIGAEGLGLVHDEHLLLADDPRELEAAIEALLADPKRAAALGERGRRLVEERYPWPSLARGLLAHWQRAARTPRT